MDIETFMNSVFTKAEDTLRTYTNGSINCRFEPVEPTDLDFAIEMPGVKKADISVKLVDQMLTVKWKDRFGQDKTYTYPDFGVYDMSKLTAKLEDGLLVIHLPVKTPPKPIETEFEIK